MTLKDILTQETYDKYGDMDIYSDCIDDYACCWCGTLLTDYGKDVYVKALSLEAEIRPDKWLGGDHHVIVILTDHMDDYEEAWEEAKAFFADMAGYIPEDSYNKRFYDEYEPEAKEISTEQKLANAIEWIYDHTNEDFKEVLESIGYTGKEIKEFGWI